MNKIYNSPKIILLIIFFVIEFFLPPLLTIFLKTTGFSSIMTYFLGKNILCNSTISDFENKK